MDFNLTEFFIKLAENNAVLSIVFVAFYLGIKRMVDRTDKGTKDLLEAQAETLRAKKEVEQKETEMRVLKRDRELTDLRGELSETKRQMESRFSMIEKNHDTFENKLSRNLDKLYGKLEQICEDITILKTESKIPGKRNNKGHNTLESDL